MIKYELMRSCRKTIAILIKNSSVIVKAPLKVDLQKIDAFVLQKENWIYRKLNQNDKKNLVFNDVLRYDKFLFFGKSFLPKIQPTKQCVFTEEFLIIPQIWFDKRLKSETAFLKKIEAFYKIEAEEFLFERIQELSNLLKLPFNSFKIINAKTKWGTCDSLNNICLNWRLCLLPPELSNYVIIHELCHTYYHNHSPAFWLFVHKYDNAYKTHKKKLKECSVIIQNLFRYENKKKI